MMRRFRSLAHSRPGKAAALGGAAATARGRAYQHPRRGFTAFEMLIVTSLFCLVASMVVYLFVTGANLYTRAEARLDSQSSALIALSRLTREMRASAYQTLTVTNTSQGVVACSFRRNPVTQLRPDGTGNPFVILWHDPIRRALGRMELERDGSFQRLTPLALVTAVANAGSSRSVAFFVRDMRITLTSTQGGSTEMSTFPAPSLRDPCITFTLTLGKSTQRSASPDDEQYSTSVVMRNKP